MKMIIYGVDFELPIYTCDDHLDFVGEICPSCNLEVNEYGNTEDRFDYCESGHCGCPEMRLCMAKNGFV